MHLFCIYLELLTPCSGILISDRHRYVFGEEFRKFEEGNHNQNAENHAYDRGRSRENVYQVRSQAIKRGLKRENWGIWVIRLHGLPLLCQLDFNGANLFLERYATSPSGILLPLHNNLRVKAVVNGIFLDVVKVNKGILANRKIGKDRTRSAVDTRNILVFLSIGFSGLFVNLRESGFTLGENCDFVE